MWAQRAVVCKTRSSSLVCSVLGVWFCLGSLGGEQGPLRVQLILRLGALVASDDEFVVVCFDGCRNVTC